MPFDGKDVTADPTTHRPFADHFLPVGNRFECDPTRPTAQNSPIFGLDGAEWRGFFFGLTGVLALVLGLAAMLMSLAGN